MGYSLVSRTTQNKKSKQTTLCSVTGVNPIRTHGLGVWGGRRVVVGVRVDEKLYKAFKPVAMLFFGSVCRPIEAFMASVISAQKVGVNPKMTMEIGKLVIERNIRSRRKLLVEETEVTEKVMVTVTCGHVDCEKVAVGHGVFREKLPLPLCDDHFGEAQRSYGQWTKLCLLEAK